MDKIRLVKSFTTIYAQGYIMPLTQQPTRFSTLADRLCSTTNSRQAPFRTHCFEPPIHRRKGTIRVSAQDRQAKTSSHVPAYRSGGYDNTQMYEYDTNQQE